MYAQDVRGNIGERSRFEVITCDRIKPLQPEEPGCTAAALRTIVAADFL
jgi:hypothetical protein